MRSLISNLTGLLAAAVSSSSASGDEGTQKKRNGSNGVRSLPGQKIRGPELDTKDEYVFPYAAVSGPTGPMAPVSEAYEKASEILASPESVAGERRRKAAGAGR